MSDDKTPRKEKHVNVRIDPDLYERAQKRARMFGGLSAVIRALLTIFANGERNFDPADIENAHKRAQKKPRKK